MYRDSSAPLLDLRRRIKVVMDVLDAIIRDGISLARSVELAAWDEILRVGPVNPVAWEDLSWLGVVILVSVGVLWGSSLLAV